MLTQNSPQPAVSRMMTHSRIMSMSFFTDLFFFIVMVIAILSCCTKLCNPGGTFRSHAPGVSAFPAFPALPDKYNMQQPFEALKNAPSRKFGKGRVRQYLPHYSHILFHLTFSLCFIQIGETRKREIIDHGSDCIPDLIEPCVILSSHIV